MKTNIFFTNEMEAKPPTHHKKGITSRKKVWTFDPVPNTKLKSPIEPRLSASDLQSL